MLFWIVITAGIFGLAIVYSDYSKIKRERENKLKKIAKRLEEIEKRESEERGNSD